MNDISTYISFKITLFVCFDWLFL